jgi:hypothetical protein
VTIVLAMIVPIMMVAVMMMRPVRVAMTVPMLMLVAVHMPVSMLMRVIMKPLARSRPARVLAEHQRLDGDRHATPFRKSCAASRRSPRVASMNVPGSGFM